MELRWQEEGGCCCCPWHSALQTQSFRGSSTAGSPEHSQSYDPFSPEKSNWSLLQFPPKFLLSVKYPPTSALMPQIPWELQGIQTLISLWKTLPIAVVQAHDQTWSLVVQPWPWHKMWMASVNKSSLVHELHREIKAMSFSSRGEQNSQSSLCWDLHFILQSET